MPYFLNFTGRICIITFFAGLYFLFSATSVEEGQETMELSDATIPLIIIAASFITGTI